MGLFVSFGFVVGCDDQIWSLRNGRHACVSMGSNRKYARIKSKLMRTVSQNVELLMRSFISSICVQVFEPRPKNVTEIFLFGRDIWYYIAPVRYKSCDNVCISTTPTKFRLLVYV